MWTSRQPGGTRSASMRASVRASRTRPPSGPRYRNPLRLPPSRTIQRSAIGLAVEQEQFRRLDCTLTSDARHVQLSTPRMTFETLTFDVRDRIATITINRPDKLNALNDATIGELGRAIDAAREREDVGGVIVTGAGAKAFVAGADIAELATQAPLDGRARALRGQDVFTR